MNEQPAASTPRRLSVLAGVVTIVVGAVRYLRGNSTLERMAGAMGHPAEAAMLQAVWHGLTAIMFVLGIAMIATAWGSRAAARWIAFVAAACFAVLTIFIGAFAAAALGNPFGLYPVFALALAAALSLVAAIRA